MTDPDDTGPGDPVDATPEDGSFDDPPTISCSRCDRTWNLAYELDDLAVGNRAFERFALDHHRHTGHYPDDVTPWIADCRQCPDAEQFLSETPARRFAETHARHTGHTVGLQPPESEETAVEPADVTGDRD